MGLNNNIRPGVKTIYTAKNYLHDSELTKLVEKHQKLLEDMKRWSEVTSIADLDIKINKSLNFDESTVNSLENNMKISKDYAKKEYEKWKNMSNQAHSHSRASTSKRKSLSQNKSTSKRSKTR